MTHLLQKNFSNGENTIGVIMSSKINYICNFSENLEAVSGEQEEKFTTDVRRLKREERRYGHSYKRRR